MNEVDSADPAPPVEISKVLRLRFLMPKFYFEISERDGSITNGEGNFA
jgi:hypothetical protein